jgi:hypothetical protein
MLYGLVRSIYRQHLKSFLTDPKALLILFVAVYTVIHLLSWALIRYRLPVDAVMVVFAGLGVVDLWKVLESRFVTSRKSMLSQR